MKVEVTCMNNGCPTVKYMSGDFVRTRQLLSAARLRGGVLGASAVDDDGNLVECPFCGEAVRVERMVDDAATFPIGNIRISEAVRRRVGPDVDAAFELRHLIERHQRGDHGSAEIPSDRVGTIYSMFSYHGTLIWIYTDPTRNYTYVTLPWEAGV